MQIANGDFRNRDFYLRTDTGEERGVVVLCTGRTRYSECIQKRYGFCVALQALLRLRHLDENAHIYTQLHSR